MELIGIGIIELLEEYPWAGSPLYNMEWLPIFGECFSAKLDLQSTVSLGHPLYMELLHLTDSLLCDITCGIDS